MQFGMIGLGRMGANMVRRLLKGGHECVVFDMSAKAVSEMAKEKAIGSASLAEFAKKLTKPRAVWLMVPAGVVDKSIADLLPHLEPGDILIDGGNSYYVDDIRRATELKAKGIHYVDVGTSGGVWGLERGYCMMIGGETEQVKHLDPIFATLAPGVGESPARLARKGRRNGRAGLSALRPERRRAFRQDGAQRHRIRRHGGLCRRAGRAPGGQHRQEDRRGRRGNHAAARPRALSVRSQPARYYRAVAARQRDRVLAARSPGDGADPGSDLSKFAGRVSDSGEGRWTIKAAIDEGVPAHVLSSALYERFSSRGEGDFANKLLSAMRYQFGGHIEKPAKP